MSTTVLADGAAAADAHDPVVINRKREPYRWVCPNGHSSWDRTNNHLWCPQCRRALESGPFELTVDQAEHWEIYDKKHDRTIPYAAVRFAEEQ